MADGPGLRVLITGGGTIAPIDDVRVITNLSTGALAAGLTAAFLRRGDSVWHVRTPSAEPPYGRGARFDLDAADPAAEHARVESLRREWLSVRDRLHPVTLPRGTAEEYADAVGTILRGESIDVAILAAAVSDFAPTPIAGKIDSRGEPPVLRLRRLPKVIASVRDWAPSIYLVGFKLLSGATEAELIEAGARACHETGADLTVANDQRAKRAGAGIEGHALYLVDRDGDGEVFEAGAGQLTRLAESIASRYAQRRHGER